jgi:hypothetical protein
MRAHVGDQLILEGVHWGDPPRVGVIADLRHPDGTPPYLVRWLDTGHESVVFPGCTAQLRTATPADVHSGGQP